MNEMNEERAQQLIEGMNVTQSELLAFIKWVAYHYFMKTIK